MKIQLIRNATMKITYAGQTILTDPMLCPRHGVRSFAGIEENPIVDLPLDMEEILEGIDSVMVSHLHPDHYEETAEEVLPRNIPIFCQPGDRSRFDQVGFTKVFPVTGSHIWEGITLTRTGGKHGKGEILERMGEVSGFVFQAPGEPTIYWAGDTIWCRETETAIQTHCPDIIITHSGGATLPGFDPIIMDSDQTLEVLNVAKKAVVVAVHMEALDHCPVKRADLRRAGDKAGVASSRLVIPADGETLTF
ncbi:MBL fold metallo-hydrolase [Desulfospira joergensenii]|uniref:MBL fold metallo-hydrolase n=1 Tax=Desulfospira joergensenii TaxID=53329 RepID=UPI0003B3D44B|nr:MBL fold metallo-hydrolase [Desulfospira joergensenii]